MGYLGIEPRLIACKVRVLFIFCTVSPVLDVFSFQVMPSTAQGLFLALGTSTTPGGTQEITWGDSD